MMGLLLMLCLAGEPAAEVERVKIDADEIGVMSEEKLRPVAEEAAKIARRNGIDPADMSVSLVWEDRQEFVYGIRVRIGDVLVDENDPRGPIVHRCPDCSTNDLVTASVEGVLEAAKLYKELTREPEEEKVVTKPKKKKPEDEEPGAKKAAPVDDPRISPLGQAGIAGIVIGSAGIVTGVAFIAIDTTRPTADPTVLRQFRPAGYISLGVGVALLATGVALLAVDRKKSKTAAVAPAVGPGYVGLQGRWRF